jgi:hypothetical protein
MLQKTQVAIIVGRAILPAAAFRVALSARVRILRPSRSRLKAASAFMYAVGLVGC